MQTNNGEGRGSGRRSWPLDLYAANIERARDLGLATLNEFRAHVSENGSLLAEVGQASDYTTRVPELVPSLAPYATWAEFGANLRGTPAEQAELLALFKAAYGEDDIHVNDVELFVGGLAEKPYGASQMGPTFTWIFQEQLDRLQDGDRFYYFNQLKDAPRSSPTSARSTSPTSLCATPASITCITTCSRWRKESTRRQGAEPRLQHASG